MSQPRITMEDVTAELERANKQLRQTAKALTSGDDTAKGYAADRAELSLCRAYGGIRIVRAYSQDPIGPRGSKSEAYRRLQTVRRTLDIINGQ